MTENGYEIPPYADPIVVIGAGIGGLSAAINLAIQGQKVLILEQSSAIGGKMGVYHDGGFRWDTGPSVITMRWVFDDLFKRAGRDLSDYIDLLPVDPLTRYFYADGTLLDVTSDPVKTAAQLSQIHPQDGVGYLRFLKYAERIYQATSDTFIDSAPPTLRTLMGANPLQMLRADPLRTMQEAIERFVASPQAQQILGRFATYTGASPFLAPATLNVIAHIELAQGVWYPRGGIHVLAEALHKLAVELGVSIRCNTPVRSIETALNASGESVRAVHTASGDRIQTQSVVANLDITAVHEQLLAPTESVRRDLHTLHRLQRSSSGFVMLLGVHGVHDQLRHHNIFFSDDYEQEFHEIFQLGLPPREPTIYLSITSKQDASHAPPGCENWFVLVNTPAENEKTHWPDLASHYAKLILARLSEKFDLDVRDRLRSMKLITPPDLERMSGAHRGALYGSSANDRWAAFRRPANRSQAIDGLYFAGGTTHPGGGVPMVTLSGKVAAQMLLNDRTEVVLKKGSPVSTPVGPE